jgi:acetyltransferase-like isoleucine patch superfamily enzyme
MPSDSDQSTVLITNGNLLSMLSLGDWLFEYGHCLKAVVITTKLPSSKSNIGGIWDMFRQSGLDYTYFKLNTNRVLPARLSFRGLPTTIPELVRLYRLPAEVIYVDNVNDPAVIDHIRGLDPNILLSFSATTRFCDNLLEVASRVAINVHYALLPGYAGLSPYYWYVHQQEPVAGITMHMMISKLDAGPILCQECFETKGICSVAGLLIRQMELVSPVLCRFYNGAINESEAVRQDLTKRSYFRHPTKAQVRDFKGRGLTFITAEDVRRLTNMARACRDRTPQIAPHRLTVQDQALAIGRYRDAATLATVEEVRRSWYVPPKKQQRTGWLVYSSDFVVATLQGCATEMERVRRTPAWVIAGGFVHAFMAVAQAIIMLLTWTPIINWFVEILARTFTRNAAGFFLRSCYWKARLKHLGKDTIIDQGVEIWGPSNVSIGSHSHIDTSVRLAAGERLHRQHGWIEIGDYVHLGPGVHIAGRGGVKIGDCVGVMANAHLYSATGVVERPSDPGQLMAMSHMAPQSQQHVLEKPIVVEDYAIIGMMVRVMPGVRISYGAVVHADCEVVHSIPPFANFGGIPRGRQIGWRRPRRPASQGDSQPPLPGAPS